MVQISSIKSKTKAFLKSCTLYPVEFCISLFLFISSVAMIEISMHKLLEKETIKTLVMDFFSEIWALSIFPFLITIVIRCDWWNRTQSNIAKYAYWASGLLVLLPGVLLSFEDMSEELIVATYVLSFGLFVSCGFYGDNRKYAYNASQMFHHLCGSIIISGVLALAYNAVAGTIVYLFLSVDKISDNILARILLFHGNLTILCLFFPMLLTHKITEARKQTDESISKVLRFCSNYILSPFLCIYTAILYVYAAKVLFTWNLPKGMLGWMVIVYIFLAFIGHGLQSILNDKRFVSFFQYLPFISVVPLTLFWVGFCKRVSDYGLTESRVYLLIFGILSTLFMVFLLSKKVNKYLLMSCIVSVAIVLLGYIPWTKALTLAAHNQVSVVNHYVKKYDLLTEDSHLKEFNDWDPKATADSAEVCRFRSAYEYLGSYRLRRRIKSIIPLDSNYSVYGRLPVEVWSLFTKDESERSDLSQIKFFNIKRKVSVPVDDYPYYGLSFSGYSHWAAADSDSVSTTNFIISDGNDDVLIQINLNEYLKKHKQLLLSNKELTNEQEMQLFVHNNDSIKLVFEQISGRIDTSRFSIDFIEIEKINIFSKKPLDNVDRFRFSPK